MSNEFHIDAVIRHAAGKADSRRLRHDQRIPAVIYGGDKGPQPIVIEQRNILRLLTNPAAYAHILTINMDGNQEKVILKALQRHPFKPLIQHADFLRINAKEKLTMKAPLRFDNEDNCKGIKQGGVLSKLMNDIEIKCLPSDLPEFISVDLINVELDHTLHLSDIKLPQGVEFAHDIDDDHNQAIASIQTPKAVAEPETDAPEDITPSEDDQSDNAEATDQ